MSAGLYHRGWQICRVRTCSRAVPELSSLAADDRRGLVIAAVGRRRWVLLEGSNNAACTGRVAAFGGARLREMCREQC